MHFCNNHHKTDLKLSQHNYILATIFKNKKFLNKKFKKQKKLLIFNKCVNDNLKILKT